MFSAHVERALRVAHDAHDGQERKGGGVPYILHPLHVTLILARVGADEVTLQAAILHDVVEDCDGWTLERVEREFGSDVRSVVAEVTEDKSKSWEDRKQALIDHLPELSSRARLVKAADKLHNLCSLLEDLRMATDPEDVWRHFSRGPEQTLAMARNLVTGLTRDLDESLARPLVEVLEELESFVHPS